MPDKIEIRKVLLFGGKAVDRPREYMKAIQKSVVKYFDQAKGLKSQYKVSEDVKVDFYFYDGTNPLGFKISSSCEHEPTEENWYEHVEEKFGNQEGCLVLCDYWWPAKYSKVRETIYRCCRNKEEVIFVCFSTVLPERTQQWVDKIIEEPHKCTIVDVALSMPKDMGLQVRVLAEAIQDVW